MHLWSGVRARVRFVVSLIGLHGVILGVFVTVLACFCLLHAWVSQQPHQKLLWAGVCVLLPLQFMLWVILMVHRHQQREELLRQARLISDQAATLTAQADTIGQQKAVIVSACLRIIELASRPRRASLTHLSTGEHKNGQSTI